MMPPSPELPWTNYWPSGKAIQSLRGFAIGPRWRTCRQSSVRSVLLSGIRLRCFGWELRRSSELNGPIVIWGVHISFAAGEGHRYDPHLICRDELLGAAIGRERQKHLE